MKNFMSIIIYVIGVGNTLKIVLGILLLIPYNSLSYDAISGR